MSDINMVERIVLTMTLHALQVHKVRIPRELARFPHPLQKMITPHFGTLLREGSAMKPATGNGGETQHVVVFGTPEPFQIHQGNAQVR